MSPEPELTVEELVELTRRQLAARGETEADIVRQQRARLERLRAEQGPESVQPVRLTAEPSRPALEARVSALEEEVKRLRDRVEKTNG